MTYIRRCRQSVDSKQSFSTEMSMRCTAAVRIIDSVKMETIRYCKLFQHFFFHGEGNGGSDPHLAHRP